MEKKSDVETLGNILIGLIFLFLGVSMIIFLIYISEMKHKDSPISISVDLPEEIELAKPEDTMIAIKRGDTVFVEFKNDP